MRLRPPATVAAALVALALAVAPLVLRAQAPGSDAPTVWGVDANVLIKVDAADGTVLFEATGGGGHALAVDRGRQVVWTYQGAELRAFDFAGTWLRTITLTNASNTTPGPLAVNPEDGSVWVSYTHRSGTGETALEHRDAQGQLLVSRPEGADHLAVDAPRGRVWAARGTILTALDAAGQVVLTLDLNAADPAGGPARGLAVDPATGQVWVARDDTVVRVSAAGAVDLIIPLPAHPVEPTPERWVARDGQGGVWAATPTALFRFDGAGSVLAQVNPWPGSTDATQPTLLTALTAEPATQAAWVATALFTRATAAWATPVDLVQIGGAGPVLQQRRLREAGGTARVSALAFSGPEPRPEVVIVAPADGSVVGTGTPTLELEYPSVGAGIDPTTLEVIADGQPWAVTCTHTAAGAACTPTAALPDGPHALAVTVADVTGQPSLPATAAITVDTVSPVVTLTAPLDGALTNVVSQAVRGEVSEPATLVVRHNGQTVETVPVASAGPFEASPVTLVEGANTLEVVALDAAGHTDQASARVTLDTAAPPALAASAVRVEILPEDQVRVTGVAGSVEPGAWVRVTNLRTGISVLVQAGTDGSFTLTIGAAPGDRLAITSTDAAQNTSAPTEVAAAPPDPALVAPALDDTGVTSLADATAFLYTGSSPIQTGVAPGTIVPTRAAVIRGRVLDRAGAPLPGVGVTVLGHPEFGHTWTRGDGMFDLAVNGGGVLTLDYQRPGYLPAQRTLSTPWADFAHAPDVVLVPLDAAVTVMAAGAAEAQVHQATPVTDADGTRRATLLVPAGTTASMVLPGGTTQPLTTLSVRATEYTVGPTGPAAMPAELPPTSAYTYAAEFSVDEALAAGATRVTFSQPVIGYLENFLGFPVGGLVPSGSYDRIRAAWVPEPDGRVIKILAITDGAADLDTDGNGVVDDGAAIGVTLAERQRLATLYSAGQSLWRVPLAHFSIADWNWPPRAPTNAVAPSGTSNNEQPNPCDAKEGGSIINCPSQILSEQLGVTGTPWRLTYASDRVPGRVAGRTATIPLSGDTIPSGVRRIELVVEIAGQRTHQTFGPGPNLVTTYTWDGRDPYGRPAQGAWPATIRIGYVYQAVYARPACTGTGLCGTAGVSFGLPTRSTSTYTTVNREALEATLWHTTEIMLGTWGARAVGLGGWTLEPHHAYDPGAGILYMGDGQRRAAENLSHVITTAAGNGTCCGVSGDGGPATQARISNTMGGAVGPDGSLYLLSNNSQVRRVAPDGTITTVAGSALQGFGGDGGPATQALLRGPRDVAVGPDGSLYIADTNNHRIRRVWPDGIIRTVAGNGMTGGGQSGVLATQTAVPSPLSVAVAPDGTFFVTTYSPEGNGIFTFLVRRVGPDGRIYTIAGKPGTGSSSGDGGPAANAELGVAEGLALGPDGSLYIAEGLHRVRRISPDGIIRTVAGTGVAGYAGDGGPATQARLNQPVDVAVGQDGTLYIAERMNDRVRRVGPDGIITTLVGTGAEGFAGDNGPASEGRLFDPWGVAVGPDGSVYVADSRNYRIRRISTPLPGFDPTEIVVASAAGAEVYVFDSLGRHLRTVDALTGVVLLRFTYDAAGRLTGIEDAHGRVTAIERDAAGAPTAIVAPGGARTTLALDAQGWLARVENPAGEAVELTSSAAGLLATLEDPRGGLYAFGYDPLGRLTRDENPAGGFSALARTPATTGHQTSLTTAEGRVSTYAVEVSDPRATRLVDTDPSGLVAVRRVGRDGRHTVTSPDGTTVEILEGGDPRFRMQAPLAKSLTVRTPAGLTATRTMARTATLAVPGDPLSLTALTETISLNGRAYTTTWSAATRTLTHRTPAGRTVVQTLDALGRVVQVERPGLASVSLTYDALGRLSSVTEGTGPDARVTTYGYDARDRLISLQDPLTRVTGFDYDLADRVTTHTRPDTEVIGLGYDASGNVTAVTPPGRPAHGFGYTPVDLEASYTPPAVPDVADPTTAYTYNLDKQPTLVTGPDGQTLSFGYDTGGRLATLTQPRGTATLAYHSTTGLLTSLTAPDGGSLTYGYDGSLLTSTTWGNGPITGSVAWTYDADFRVATEAITGAQSVTYTYDPDSLVTGAGALTLTRDPQTGFLTGTTVGAVTDSRTYTTFGELDTYTAQVSGTPVLQVGYVRDTLGRIVEKTETLEGVTTVTGYRYDAVDRLDQVTVDGVVTATYTYDANGNRLSVTTPSGTEAATYDAQDRLLTYGGATYTYTANGELRTKTDAAGTTTYTYDLAGNLTRVEFPDGRVIAYLIDGQNRRIGKKVDGVLVQGWLYRDSLKPVAELDGAGQVVARFVYGSNPLVPDYVVKGGATYRILTDHLGSPRLVVDTVAGAVVQRRDYDAWGRVTLDTNPLFQPFGFAGGLDDPDTRLVRFGARDYDPEVGRWTAKDPVDFDGGDSNLYAYAAGDPVDLVDPTGEDWTDWDLYWLADLSAGFADTITFGLTATLRDWQGVSRFVNECSWSYLGGQVGGIAWLTAVSGTGGAARAATRYELTLLRSTWYKSTFPFPSSSMAYHWLRHAQRYGKSLRQYTDDAVAFFKANSGRAKPVLLNDRSPGLLIRLGRKQPGGFFTPDGRVVSFWYR